MNKKRLLKLADLLEADAANKKGVKFDLGIWAGPSDNGLGTFEDGSDRAVPVGCGTTACAVGLACISGAFKRSGLTYDFGPMFGSESGFRLRPRFGAYSEFDAVEAFFSIDRMQAEFLFLTDRYPDSKTRGAAGERYVAKRIRDFVAGKAAA